MRIKRVFFVAALMIVAALNFSCEEQSTAEEDQLYDSIRKDETKDQDT